MSKIMSWQSNCSIGQYTEVYTFGKPLRASFLLSVVYITDIMTLWNCLLYIRHSDTVSKDNFRGGGITSIYKVYRFVPLSREGF